MRLQTLTYMSLSLLSLVAATPTKVEVMGKDLATRSTETGLQIIVGGETLAPDVSVKCLLKCAKALAKSTCLLAAINLDTKEALLKCVENVDEICPCGDCIPGLGPFLTKFNVCALIKGT